MCITLKLPFICSVTSFNLLGTGFLTRPSRGYNLKSACMDISLDMVEGRSPFVLPLVVGAAKDGDGAARLGVGDSESCCPAVFEARAATEVGVFAKLADCWPRMSSQLRRTKLKERGGE